LQSLGPGVPVEKRLGTLLNNSLAREPTYPLFTNGYYYLHDERGQDENEPIGGPLVRFDVRDFAEGMDIKICHAADSCPAMFQTFRRGYGPRSTVLVARVYSFSFIMFPVSIFL